MRTSRPALEAEEGVLPVSHFAKCFLLLVRSRHDVPRACQEVGELLAFQRARLPRGHTEQDRRLVGIWLDPLMVDTPPEVWGSVSVSSPFRMRESVAASGIWCLCWLDVDHPRKPSNLVTLRETLVSALIEERPPHPHPRTLQFVPVFDADDDRHSDLLHTKRLRELFPALIGEPVTWNRATGALAAVPETGERRRSL